MHCRVGANTKQPLFHSMLYFWYWKVVIMFTTFHCQKNNWDLVPKLNAKKSWSSEPCRIFTVKANIGHIVCFVLVNTYSWVPNRSYPPLINFLIFFPPKKFLFQSLRLLIIGESFQPRQTFWNNILMLTCFAIS